MYIQFQRLKPLPTGDVWRQGFKVLHALWMIWTPSWEPQGWSGEVCLARGSLHCQFWIWQLYDNFENFVWFFWGSMGVWFVCRNGTYIEEMEGASLHGKNQTHKGQDKAMILILKNCKNEDSMPCWDLDVSGHICTNSWASRQDKTSAQMPKPISNYFIHFILYLFEIN